MAHISWAIVKRCPERLIRKAITELMHITHDKLQEITEVIEDTIEYACDHHQLSGEMVWKLVECLAVAKQAEIAGLVTSDVA